VLERDSPRWRVLSIRTMGKTIMADFRPVKFEIGKVHIAGGHASKPMPVVSQTVASAEGTNYTFVKISAVEPWLRTCTTGNRRWGNETYGRTSLLQTLREKIDRICDGADGGCMAVSNAAAEYDPMMEVEKDEGDNVASSSKIRGQGLKRTRYYKNPASKSIVTVDMPVRCPEEDADCKEMHKVLLYIADRKSIWIALTNVDWAVRYLYVQNHLKGVPLISEDDVGPGAFPIMNQPAQHQPVQL
jgi:hypothetical protein